MNSDEIRILSEVEAVRQNPAMYIGSVCEKGAHHLLSELIYNSVDEALLGHCTEIHLRLGSDFCEIEDNGRGIPTEIHSQEGISSCVVALTRLHSGSKFQKSEGQFTAGLHGVGLSCVNALSSSLEVTVDRNGHRHEQKYVRGLPQTDFLETSQTTHHGTKIRFSPDPTIFRTFTGFNLTECRDLLENIAHLSPGLTLTLEDSRNKYKEAFQFSPPQNSKGSSLAAGLHALLSKQLSHRRPLTPSPLGVGFSTERLQFDAQFLWCAESDPALHSFVNCVPTTLGGTHVNAFRVGLMKAVNLTFQQEFTAEMDEVSEGLTALISCRMLRPHFEGQTKSRLTNTEILESIESFTFHQVSRYFQDHPQVAAIIGERIRDARNARMASQRVGQRIYFQHGRKEIDEEVYKEQFGERSKNWHDSAVWITDQELLKSHAALCQVSEDSVALDVCCGSGVVGESFRGKVKKIIGLDLTPQMVSLARQRLDEVHQGNVYHLPFQENTFDLVCTREVLHLLPYPEKPVSEIFRVMKPGGQFIVGQILPFSEDDGPWMYRVFKKKQPLIYNMFQEEDFRRMLLSAGFTHLEMTEICVWESIDVWINSYETTAIHRHEIRELFRKAPAEARAVHPFRISPTGEIQDLWRWCIYSVRKPT